MRLHATLVALGLVVAAGGSAEAARPEYACQLLPIVLDVEASGTRYLTEISFSNPNEAALGVSVRYTPSLGRVEGAGDGEFSVAGGEQLFVEDGIEFLRQLGIAVEASGPDSPQAGTLKICGLDPARVPVGVMARITAPTRPPHPSGSAGVSFGTVPADEGFTGRATVFGFRQTVSDRTNVAVYNPGAEPVSVKVTVISAVNDRQAVLSEREDLAPYGWRQFSNPSGLAQDFDNGYVRVERVSAGGVFGAYGVVNDNATNDGSFVPAVDEGSLGTSFTIPVVVDSLAYRSELILANPGNADATYVLTFVDSISRPSVPLSATLPMPARRQAIIPDVFELFGVGVWAGGTQTRAGTLRIAALEEDAPGAFVGVRVLTRQEEGRFGVFAPSVPPGSANADQGFLWGLRADAGTRSNVAVLNAGEPGGEDVTLQLQVFDGASGRPAGAPLTITLEPGQWAQPDGFFTKAGVAHGDVRITRVVGEGPWWAYGVVNDGGAAGEGTGDGSFVPVVFNGVPEPLAEGAWGEPGIRMWVDGTGVALEADCAHGRIDGPVFLDPLGRFSGSGIWAFEGGPAPVGGFPEHPVLFSGQVEEDRLTLTIRFLHQAVSDEIRLTATRGLFPQLSKCL
jgi:hypothetical protein